MPRQLPFSRSSGAAAEEVFWVLGSILGWGVCSRECHCACRGHNGMLLLLVLGFRVLGLRV